jgi:hypothetical protein
VKNARNKLSLFLLAGILPLFFILAVITPAWIYFTGESFFLANMLEFAEVPLGNESGLTYRLLNCWRCWRYSIYPPGFSPGDLAGDPRHSIRQKTHHSEPRPGAEGKKIALAMLGMGLLLPLFRFLVPLVFTGRILIPRSFFYLAILSCC